MAASGTAIQVATECCSAAELDGVQHAQMEPRQPGPVLYDEAVAVLSDDVGHLERWPLHRSDLSVAVRQNSMAYSTRRWSHVNQDRCFTMKLLPYCRMMSATSKGGRFIVPI